MATGPVVNQGKGKFLREFLASNRDAKVEEAAAAWKAGGHDDGISESLVSKIRSELGLTGKRGSNGRATGDDGSKKVKSSPNGTKSKAKRSPESPPSPDDREEAKGPSRTAFVEEVLGREPGANMKKVNEAWASAGHEGQISPSIYYKVKKERGGTGESESTGRSDLQASEAGTAVGVREKAPQEPHALPVATATTARSSSDASGDLGRVVDEVEAGIDNLIFTLKVNGGMPEVEAALRAARRLMIRRQEG